MLLSKFAKVTGIWGVRWQGMEEAMVLCTRSETLQLQRAGQPAD